MKDDEINVKSMSISLSNFQFREELNLLVDKKKIRKSLRSLVFYLNNIVNTTKNYTKKMNINNIFAILDMSIKINNKRNKAN